MLYYARCDTHYLLYVYDILRNELVARSDQKDPQKNLIEYTLQRSKEVSLDRYTPFTADTTTGEGARGWAGVLQKTYANLDGQQFAVYRAVHKWRDDLARQEDENPNYIMPQQTLMEVSKILPSDPKALWSLMGNKCSQKAKQSVDKLFEVILEAKKTGSNERGSIDFFRSTYADPSLATVAKREIVKEAELPPVEQLQSHASQLFGSMPLSSAWEGSDKATTDVDNMLISLPWTQFVQDAVHFASQEESKAKAKTDIDIIPLEDKKPAAPTSTPADVDNTEFTLRQGRKRKVDEVEVEDSDTEDEGGAALNQDMISLNDDEPVSSRKARKKSEKVARKAAIKAQREAKRQAKLERKQQRKAEGAAKPEEDEEPFDYSKAQSVLHAQRSMATDASANNAQGSGKKKAFDPYAARMSAEGPKPARRMHSERAGKTATFKK